MNFGLLVGSRVFFGQSPCAQFAMALCSKTDAGKTFGAEQRDMEQRIGFTIRRLLVKKRSPRSF